MKQINLSLSLLFISWLAVSQTFYNGVDMSYVNEMEDCGAVYYENGTAKDPFQIMADHGANLVRVRIWHNPQAWSAHPTSYSSYTDARNTIQRAKSLGLKVLLDFHYSDTWTDPSKQIIPSAWESDVNNTSTLATHMYNYTFQVLSDLDADGLMPELVQVGNETNGNMLSLEGGDLYPVEWTRQAAIINAGISAVRDAGNQSAIQPEIVLHVADPNNGSWWFGEATSNGISDFDIIGLSFYPQWHSGSVSQTGNIVENLKNTHNKKVMLVEVGVPWTNDWNDDATNMLDGLPNGYGKTKPTGQRNWLIDIATEVSARGGSGVIYWEPAWVSTGCSTEWGQGSHWENATFFDFNNELISNGGVQFLEQNYGGSDPVPVTGVSVTPSSATIGVGNTVSLSETVSPADATDKSVSWSSDNTAVATVDQNGLVTGVSLGAATITVTTTDGSYTDSSNITVDDQTPPPGGNVTFRVDMTGVNGAQGGFVTGDFSGSPNWQIIQMVDEGNNIYSYTTTISEGTTGAYYFLKRNNWNARESVPSACALQFGTDREFVITSGSNTFAFEYGSCNAISGGARLADGDVLEAESHLEVYPNPADQFITLRNEKFNELKVIDVSGAVVLKLNLRLGRQQLDISALNKGVYLLQFQDTKGNIETKRIIKN